MGTPATRRARGPCHACGALRCELRSEGHLGLATNLLSRPQGIAQSRADAAVLEASGKARLRRGLPQQIIQVLLRVGGQGVSPARVQGFEELELVHEVQHFQKPRVVKSKP